LLSLEIKIGLRLTTLQLLIDKIKPMLCQMKKNCSKHSFSVIEGKIVDLARRFENTQKKVNCPAQKKG
jgi:hypothetical protein